MKSFIEEAEENFRDERQQGIGYDPVKRRSSVGSCKIVQKNSNYCSSSGRNTTRVYKSYSNLVLESKSQQ